jgi:sulfonate transport system substrate-binding protein
LKIEAMTIPTIYADATRLSRPSALRDALANAQAAIRDAGTRALCLVPVRRVPLCRVPHYLRPMCLALIPVLALLAAGNAAAQAAPATVRIGYQKYGTLILLKARGTLDQRLAARGVTVRWTEFPAGPQLLEGLNVGSIDVGTTGEAPPIFAQAAGADLVYIGNEPAAPQAEAIVVPPGSPIRTVAELRGKRVALNKGSNVHYLLVRALEHAGLRYEDIQPVYLTPADARAAFERGSVDAWAIWDPFFAAAQSQLHARVLADGTGLVQNHQFYLAARRFAQQYPELVKDILDEVRKVDDWGRANPREVAEFLAPQLGLDIATADVAARRYRFGAAPVSAAVIAEQQRIADTFSGLKLIPAPIVVRDATPAPALAGR